MEAKDWGLQIPLQKTTTNQDAELWSSVLIHEALPQLRLWEHVQEGTERLLKDRGVCWNYNVQSMGSM